MELSDLITSAIQGVTPEGGEIEKVASHQEPVDLDIEGIEKLASALEYVAERGIDSFVKEAADYTVKSSGKGNNAGSGQSFGSSERKTHHSGLASNEAATNLTPDARNKMIDPTLKSLLSNANPDSIHSPKISKSGIGKVASVISPEAKEQLRQAIAAKLGQGE